MNKKTWCIVGGSGSLGKALTRRILDRYDPKKIIILSRGEVKQAAMREEFPDERMRFVIGDVRDRDRLHLAFRGVDYVILAAALKRVEVCEYNAIEAAQINVGGAIATVQAAIDAGVKRVCFTSTDKACAALNTYGATKFLAERIIVNGNQYSGGKTIFCCTRYGNVAGSRGSVIPFWRRQLAEGKPVSITDASMTRFWMTLQESVDLVLYALQTTRGGEVYVPDLPAYRLDKLAEAMAGDNTVVVGLRPGEKMHESMVSADEMPNCFRDEKNFYRILPEWYTHRDGLQTMTTKGLRSDTAVMLMVDDLRERLKEV